MYTKDELAKTITHIEKAWAMTWPVPEHKILIGMLRAGLEIKFAKSDVDGLKAAKDIIAVAEK